MSKIPQQHPSFAGSKPVEAGPSNQGSVSAKSKSSRRRLTSAGSKILKEFLQKHQGVRPSSEQQHELLAKIKATQGCEHWGKKNLSVWICVHFPRKRTPRRGTDGQESFAGLEGSLSSSTQGQPEVNVKNPGAVDPRFPSLSPNIIPLLQFLYQTSSLNEIAHHLASFGATEPDIRAWISAQKETTAQLQRLATPNHTVSPRASAISPIESYLEDTFSSSPEPPPRESPVILTGLSVIPSSPHHDLHKVCPEPVKVEGGILRIDRTLQAILEGVTEVMQSSGKEAKKPRTSAEFTSMFAPYQEKMAFLKSALKN